MPLGVLPLTRPERLVYRLALASCLLAPGCFDASKLMSGVDAGAQDDEEAEDDDESETGSSEMDEGESSDDSVSESDSTSGSEVVEAGPSSSMASVSGGEEDNDAGSATSDPTNDDDTTTATNDPDDGPDTAGELEAEAGEEGGVSDTGEDPGPMFVENEGADCVTGNPPLPGASTADLADPFEGWDSVRITALADWRCHRQRILREAQAYVYGTKPEKPEMVTGFVSETEISVEVTHQGSRITFGAAVELPTSGSPPYPAMIGISGFFGLNSSIIQDEGIATITFDPMVVGSESGERSEKLGAFYTLYGSDNAAGLLIAWAWGVSRLLDVVADAGGEILQPDAIGITGCSRYGRGALVTGAFDQRIALTIPIESGTGGVPILRGSEAEGALTPREIFGETYWLGDAFDEFADDVSQLPVDSHHVLAMVAPRGLLILDNPHLPSLGPISGHVAALAGAEVYDALGAIDSISYHSDVESGSHCAAKSEHGTVLRESLERHLTKRGSAPGTIVAHADATGDLAAWADWRAPDLE